MITGRIRFLASTIAPKPEEVDYWIDLQENPYGFVIKSYNGVYWKKLDLDIYEFINNELREKLNRIESIEVNVDDNVGLPSGTAVTDGNQIIFNFSNLKGDKGDTGPQGPLGNSGVTGVPDDLVVVNSLDGGESEEGSIKVLAAEQGKVLNEKHVTLTKEEYDSLSVKDDNKYYYIIEE